MAEARQRRSIPVGRAKPIMIQGTMSNAGKSLLAAVHAWHVGELATEGDEGVGF